MNQNSFPKFLGFRINPLQAGQNAALLLNDLDACRYSLSGDSNQSEYSSRGVPSKSSLVGPSRATMSHVQNPGSPRPVSRENGMKDVTKWVASEVLAQMMAVTAMIVIASVVFHWR